MVEGKGCDICLFGWAWLRLPFLSFQLSLPIVPGSLVTFIYEPAGFVFPSCHSSCPCLLIVPGSLVTFIYEPAGFVCQFNMACMDQSQ